MIRNQGEDEIPHLFKYVQMTLAGNNHSPQYGHLKSFMPFGKRKRVKDF